MPIYEYQCANCGFQQEVIQKISDEPLKVCPQCGKASMKKMVSAAAFRLKGGGWYETDFKSGKQKNIADSGADKKPKDKAAAGDKATTGGSSTSTKRKAAPRNNC